MIEATKMKPRSRHILISTIVLYVLLAVSPDKFVAATYIGVYGVLLYRIVRQMPLVLSLLYVAGLSLPFGKFIPIELVSQPELAVFWRPFGIAADITVTLRHAIALGMGVYLLFDFVRRKKRVQNDGIAQALAVLPVVFLISAVMGSRRVDVSFLHSIFYAEPFFVYVFVRQYASKVWIPLIYGMLAIAVMYASVIVIAQQIQHHTLGLVVENYPGYTPIDEGADAGGVYRFGGLFAHANILASVLVVAMLLLVPHVSSTTRNAAPVASLCIGICALILTQSRAAWLSFVLGMGSMYQNIRGIFAMKQTQRFFLLFIPVFLVLVGVSVFPRVLSVPRVSETEGGLAMRAAQNNTAYHIIRQSPFFGVGLGMDVLAMHEAAIRDGGPLLYNPEPVHNGIFRLLLSVGGVGFVAYCIACVVAALRVNRAFRHATVTEKRYLSGLIAAGGASFVLAQFQPVYPDMGLLAFFTALLIL